MTRTLTNVTCEVKGGKFEITNCKLVIGQLIQIKNSYWKYLTTHSFLIQDISIVIDICFDLILCEEYISMTWAEDSLKLAPKYQGQKVNLTLIAPVVNTEYKLSRWISNISPPEYKINLMYSYDEQWVISFWESLGIF